MATDLEMAARIDPEEAIRIAMARLAAAERPYPPLSIERSDLPRDEPVPQAAFQRLQEQYRALPKGSPERKYGIVTERDAAAGKEYVYDRYGNLVRQGFRPSRGKSGTVNRARFVLESIFAPKLHAGEVKQRQADVAARQAEQRILDTRAYQDFMADAQNRQVDMNRRAAEWTRALGMAGLLSERERNRILEQYRRDQVAGLPDLRSAQAEEARAHAKYWEGGGAGGGDKYKAGIAKEILNLEYELDALDAAEKKLEGDKGRDILERLPGVGGIWRGTTLSLGGQEIEVDEKDIPRYLAEVQKRKKWVSDRLDQLRTATTGKRYENEINEVPGPSPGHVGDETKGAPAPVERRDHPFMRGASTSPHWPFNPVGAGAAGLLEMARAAVQPQPTAPPAPPAPPTPAGGPALDEEGMIGSPTAAGYDLDEDLITQSWNSPRAQRYIPNPSELGPDDWGEMDEAMQRFYAVLEDFEMQGADVQSREIQRLAYEFAKGLE